MCDDMLRTNRKTDLRILFKKTKIFYVMSLYY